MVFGLGLDWEIVHTNQAILNSPTGTIILQILSNHVNVSIKQILYSSTGLIILRYKSYLIMYLSLV